MIEMTGKVVSLGRDYHSRKPSVTFVMDQELEEIEELGDANLTIKVARKLEKRSIDANAYFYVLVNRIAEKLNKSDREVHDKLLSENICFIHDEYGTIEFCDREWSANEFRLYRDNDQYWYDSLIKVIPHRENGQPLLRNGQPIVRTVFFHIKGSHQMDSKEMSRLIESTKADCHELGIQTATPEDEARYMALWTRRKGKQESQQETEGRQQNDRSR